jgi:Acetyltransferase (GNAT) domain
MRTMNASTLSCEAANVARGAEIRITPLAHMQERWNEFTRSSSAATLYHRAQWTEALRRAYGFRILVVTIEDAREIVAGCLFAPSKIPFVGRVVGLPFSDSCAPLGTGDDSVRELLEGLAREPRVRGGIELRGVEAPPPWRTVDCFHEWSLDLARPLSDIKRTVDRNFRRQVRHAVDDAFRIDSGDSADLLGRFYRLQLQTRRRLGLPPQPLRFFTLVREEFARTSSFEVWVASRSGIDHAAVVLLRDGARLYAKWSARAEQAANGASHLVFSSIIEHYAGKVAALDLGRTDIRNTGLVRFKREMGAVPSLLPYSFFPNLRQALNAESPDRSAGLMARVWRRLPLAVTRAIGAAAYGFLG